MAKCGMYICAQLKRVRKVFPVIIVTTLFLVLGMALLMWGILEKDNSSEEKQKMQIGLTGDLEGSYLGIGIQTIQNLDSSRFAISFLDMTEEEAKEQLMQGKIAAYVVVPDGFVDSLTSGENLPVTYVTSAGSTGVGSMVMNELVDTISKLIVESQNAIYGTQTFMLEHNMEDVYWDATNELYLRIVNFILGRTQVYELEILGESNNLSLVSYYVCGILVLFLLLWGIVCSPLFAKRSVALSKLLKARGQSVLSQVTGEYVAYVVLMLGTMLLIFLLLTIAMHMTGFNPPEWEGMGSSVVFAFFLQMVPVVLVISALQFLIYEAVPGMVGSIFAQFLCALCLGYLSGCLYPISFFPEIIQTVSGWLPSGAAIQYAGKCLRAVPVVKECVIMAGYWICFMGLAVGVRRNKIRNS